MSVLQPQYFFSLPKKRPVQAAIFLSGSGGNAERILEVNASQSPAPYRIACLVTDRPETSRAEEIAQKYNLPLVQEDIRKFYRSNGEKRISLSTPKGRDLRREWTNRLRLALKPYAIDFGLLAGFVPLCNITADFPCLNVHPGDLTQTSQGRRTLVGLHTIPVERAILGGFSSLRSSVIIACPYSGDGNDDMDSGHILGVSPPVPIHFQGWSLEELQKIAAMRPSRRPPGGYRDALQAVAAHNQKRLKYAGDFVVFPPVAAAFAAGRYGENEQKKLCFCDEAGNWQPVETVEFSADGQARPLLR